MIRTCHGRFPLSQFGCLGRKCVLQMECRICAFSFFHNIPQSNFAKSLSYVSSFALCLWPQRLMCFLSWQVYLINVTYSDNTSHIIYRRYSKFFDLQVIIHQSQTVSPLSTVQVGLLLKSFTCFPFVHSEPVNRHDCLYRLIFKPGDFSLHLCLYSTPWHLYESVRGLVIDRGAGETWRVSVSLIELQLHAASLSLSLWCLSIFTFPSSRPHVLLSHLISSLPHPQNVRELTGLFMEQAGKLKGEFNVLSLWQFINETPHEGGFLFLVEAGFMNGAWGCTESIALYLFHKQFPTIWIFVCSLDPQPASNWYHMYTGAQGHQ